MKSRNRKKGEKYESEDMDSFIEDLEDDEDEK